MKISTEIHSAARLVGEEKAIEYYAKAGFDAWDLSMFSMCNYDWANRRLMPNDHPFAGNDYLKFVRKLRLIGEDNGIHCNQSHAPFPTRCPEIRAFYERAIECTAEAGGKICIIHPDNDLSAEQNAEMYGRLLPFAKSCGVKIATENMWNWNNEANRAAPAACSSPKSMLDHLAAVNDPDFVVCLDIGHAEMMDDTSAVEMIEALGSEHLQALHMHDNDKIHDSHKLPLTMNINYPPIIKALKKIGYKGYFTLEADQHLKGYTDEVFAGIQIMAKTARKLADEFEAD